MALSGAGPALGYNIVGEERDVKLIRFKMFSRSKSLLVLLVAVGLALVGFQQRALAVSAGGYSPAQQDCAPNSARNDAPTGATQPGCHNVALNVAGNDGTRYAEVGLDQLPQGYPGTPTPVSVGYPGSRNAIHSGCASLNLSGTNGGTGVGCGTGAGPGVASTFNTQDLQANHPSVQTGPPNTGAITHLLTNGLVTYFGQDDNTDAGEHDGVSGHNGTAGSVNGPSDGGAVIVSANPAAAGQVPSATNPLPVAGAQEGSCADGICQETTTSRQVVYQGCGTNAQTACRRGSAPSRDVYNYAGKPWDPYNCSSGTAVEESPGPAGCGNMTMDQWRQAEAQQVVAQPGFQFFEDPDPQGSPAAPIYPLPAAYAGTCGVAAGGGQAPAIPTILLPNSAGQAVVAPTGC
ncbi:MAG: hypothetical protein M3R71_01610 [Actinomycetota bacterium]|nr:hypothetical protein [Actinomycetota bacterium]